MIARNSENETNIVLCKVERKEWRQPKIYQLSVKNTQGGRLAWNREIDFFNFSYDSTAS